MRHRQQLMVVASVVAAACGKLSKAESGKVPEVAGAAVAVIDAVQPEYFEAAGVAEAIEHVTLSTRLMATVTAVLPLEGARVQRGDVLVHLDASDLDAKRKQATAGVVEATTMHDLAELNVKRMRALYADSAAPKAQLEAAEAALARSNSMVDGAHAAAAEVEATAAYAEVRAPFDGVVTHRFVDAGAFASPGAPLLTVEASDRLRISVTIPAPLAKGLIVGMHITGRLEQEAVDAVIEGVVPSGSNLYTINAIIANPGNKHLVGGAATLLVTTGTRHVVMVPSAALLRQGDLVGVRRRMNGGAELTWLRIGGASGSMTEVLAGLAVGDSVLVPAASNGPR